LKGWFKRMMALRMTNNLRIQAVNDTQKRCVWIPIKGWVRVPKSAGVDPQRSLRVAEAAKRGQAPIMRGQVGEVGRHEDRTYRVIIEGN
jgi:hypothetical protein